MSRGPGLRGLFPMNLPPSRNPVATRELLQGPAAGQVSTSMQQMGAREGAMAPVVMSQAMSGQRQAVTAAMAQQNTQQLLADQFLQNAKDRLNAMTAQATGQLLPGTAALQARGLDPLSPPELMAAIGM